MTPVEQLRTTLAALSLTAIDARLEGLLETASKKEPSVPMTTTEEIFIARSVRTRRMNRPPIRMRGCTRRATARSRS